MAWSLLLFWMLACGGSADSGTAKLNAAVEFTGSVFVVKNTGSDSWREIEIRVNDDFRARFDAIPGGGSKSIFATELAKSDGTRFNPLTFKAQDVMLIAILPNGQRGYYTARW